jgi:ribulose-5-phosphate 4-epimerase/fuculose-1-phosphate aldolase
LKVINKNDVLEAAKGMLRLGLVAGTAGNVSGRLAEDRICLTPSSVSYETMTVDDLVVTDLELAAYRTAHEKVPGTRRAKPAPAVEHR